MRSEVFKLLIDSKFPYPLLVTGGGGDDDGGAGGPLILFAKINE